MKILLTGTSGQVGYALRHSLAGMGELVCPGRQQLDLAHPEQLRDAVRALRPDLIVNPAAYTAVDRAETEAELAFRVNAEAPGVLAQEALRLNIPIVHFSTDYVFDGQQGGCYRETDAAHPVNVYGRSKLAGEQAVRDSGAAHLILRTSWVYGMRGKNFMLTMLRLAKQGAPLRVVDDQFGAPTWSHTVADATVQLLHAAWRADPSWWDRHGGLLHLTAQGSTSWHGFAEAIMRHAGLPCSVARASSAGWGGAPRPPNGRLCTDRLQGLIGPMPEWEAALAECLAWPTRLEGTE